MKDSVYELCFDCLHSILRVINFLDWSLGIDTSGLYAAMDWPFYFLFVAKHGHFPSLLGERVLAAPWYWGERNAEESHYLRPWRPEPDNSDIPF